MEPLPTRLLIKSIWKPEPAKIKRVRGRLAAHAVRRAESNSLPVSELSVALAEAVEMVGSGRLVIGRGRMGERQLGHAGRRALFLGVFRVPQKGMSCIEPQGYRASSSY